VTTAEWTKERILELIATNHTMVGRSLVKLLARQTADEVATKTTRYHNGVGFSGPDATILTSFAQQFAQKGYLSNKQLALARKRLPKYHRQLLEEANAA